MESTFTWIPLYTELAGLLLDWEDRQDELIACLDKLRSEGVKVTPLNDKDKDGASFLIKEIDPFTFLGSFNRQTRPCCLPQHSGVYRASTRRCQQPDVDLTFPEVLRAGSFSACLKIAELKNSTITDCVC